MCRGVPVHRGTRNILALMRADRASVGLDWRGTGGARGPLCPPGASGHPVPVGVG
jgi:hypothetical protein